MSKDYSKFFDQISEANQREEVLHKNSKVLIVDSLNTFLRSFVAIHHMNTQGNHIGGLTGFLKSIGSVIRHVEPTRVILVFDGVGGSTNKRYLYPEYKANRTHSSSGCISASSSAVFTVVSLVSFLSHIANSCRAVTVI